MKKLKQFIICGFLTITIFIIYIICEPNAIYKIRKMDSNIYNYFYNLAKSYQYHEFSFHPQELINTEKLKENNIFANYLIGFSSCELEEQFIKNFVITCHDKRIKYDYQKNKLIIKNIDSLLNQTFYFARTHFKINPGISEFRQEFSLDIRFYLKIIYENNNYMISLEKQI